MTRRISKNQYGYRNPQEEIERARATAYRAPRRISPAQMAAQSYVKNPLQLGLTTIGRRAARAQGPIDEWGNAAGNLGTNIVGVIGAPVKSGLKAYFQNANDKGELKNWSPVLGSMANSSWQQLSQLPASTMRLARATMNAREPVQDFLGGLGELGYSGLYRAGKAIQRQADKSIPAMYQNTRDMLMPFLQDETSTRGNTGTYKRATMCKCGSGMSKSACKCGANGKSAKRSVKKRSMKKADYWYNNAPSRNPASPTQRPLTDDEMAIIWDGMPSPYDPNNTSYKKVPRSKPNNPSINLPTGGVKPDRPRWIPPMRQMPGGRGRPRRHDLLARPTDEIYQDTMEMTYDGSRPNRRRIFPFKSQQVSQSSQSSWKPNGAMIGAMMGATRQPNTTGIMGSAAMKRMTKSSKSSSSSRIHPAQLAAMYDANKTWERKQKLDAARWEKLGNSPIMAIAEMIAETIPGSTKGGGPFGYIKGANLAWSKTPGSISGKQSATTKRLSKRQAGPKPNKYM